MKYTQIPANTFQNLQMNAGILVDSFDPSTGEFVNIIGATTGGTTFQDALSWKDFGEDIDNCPKNTKELKKVDQHDVTMAGTFLTVDASTAKRLAAVADIDAEDNTHIIPRNDVLTTDFEDIWWVGDYSDENTGASAGFIAIRLMNALNTGGFQIKSTDKDKGQFAFTFTGHYSIANQDQVPYDMYVRGGSDSEIGSITLNRHYLRLVADGAHYTLRATTSPAEGGTVLFRVSSSGSSVITLNVQTGEITPVGEGDCIVYGCLILDGVEYEDCCTVVVDPATELEAEDSEIIGG